MEVLIDANHNDNNFGFEKDDIKNEIDNEKINKLKENVILNHQKIFGRDSMNPKHNLLDSSIRNTLKRLNTPHSLAKMAEMGILPDGTIESFNVEQFSKNFKSEYFFSLSNSSIDPNIFDSKSDSNLFTNNHPDNFNSNIPNKPNKILNSKIASLKNNGNISHLKHQKSFRFDSLGNFVVEDNEVKKPTVKDIRFETLEMPPIQLQYDKLAERTVKALEIPASQNDSEFKKIFEEKYLSKENYSILEIMFWFVFCAFFQPETLHTFVTPKGPIEELSKKMTHFFWQTSGDFRSLVFEIYPHAVCYSISKALKVHFPDSRKKLFSKSFFIRIHQLVFEVLTGVSFQESYISKQQRHLFPRKKKDIIKAVIRNKKEKNYYSSDEESTETNNISQQNDSSSFQKKKLKRTLKGKRKNSKQSLSEFISNPPDIKGEIETLCNQADSELEPLVEKIQTTESNSRFPTYKSNSKFLINSRSNAAIIIPPSISRNGTLPLLKNSNSKQSLKRNLNGNLNENDDLMNDDTNSTFGSPESKRPNNTTNKNPIKENINFLIDHGDNSNNISALDNDKIIENNDSLNKTSKKSKIKIKFVTNVNAAKEKISNNQDNFGILKNTSPRLNSEHFEKVMKKIRKKSKQLNRDSSAFSSPTPTMTNICMSPLISMQVDTPIDFSSPGRKRHVKFNQTHSHETKYFFQNQEKKNLQHLTLKHQNLWVFPDSKLRFKYSLMRQQMQIDGIGDISQKSIEELQRIEENNKISLQTLDKEYKEIISEPTGEMLREECKKMVNSTLGVQGFIPGPRGLGAQEQYIRNRHLQPIGNQSKIQPDIGKDPFLNRSSFKDQDPRFKIKGSSLAANAINYSDFLKDEIIQFEKRIDQIAKRTKNNV